VSTAERYSSGTLQSINRALNTINLTKRITIKWEKEAVFPLR
jgi:hypothetical protein